MSGGKPEGPAQAGETRALDLGPRPGRRFLHLAVLSAFCFAEPMLVPTNATLFVGYGAAPVDVFVAATLFFVVPPAILLGAEELGGLAREGWRQRLHLVFVGGLAALGTSTLLLGAGGTIGRLLAALIGGVAFALAYRRFNGLRTTLTVLSPTPLVFLLLYLLASPVSDFTLASQDGIEIERVRGGAPVVMIVLDELPTTSLLDAHERVNARRYPNFARLERGSDWFRNATTVHWETHRAVPALLSAGLTGTDDTPSVVDHPHNLFTLLGGSYDVRAEEPYARLCPERLCHATAKRSFGERLAGVMKNLTLLSATVSIPDGIRNGLSIPGPSEAEEDDPPAEVERFAGRLGRPASEGRPPLDYMHVLLPHIPWERMPSGKRYQLEREGFTGLAGRDEWTGDRQKVLEGQQRHLLQLAYTDRVLGRVLDRLRATGAYDRSLIVVVADHGVSFKADEQRREANARTAADILPVPLFVKRPGQRRGRVLDRHVETVDVVPTIADVLGVEIPFETEGRSAYARDDGSRPTIYTEPGERVSLSLDQLRRARRAALRRQLALFGVGPADPTLFAVGPRPDLIGRRVASLRGMDGGLEAEVFDDEALEDVDRADELLPTRIAGRLSESGPRDLAVALNGVVVATTRTHSDDGGDQFAAIVPERSLRDGANEVELFEIGAPGRPLKEISVEG